MTTNTEEPNWLDIELTKFRAVLEADEIAEGVPKQAWGEFKQAIRSHIAEEEYLTRIDELQQLADFIVSCRIYDQDSAMKLRYHFDRRIKDLRSKLTELTTGAGDSSARKP